jgi:hypothetical protein
LIVETASCRTSIRNCLSVLPIQRLVRHAALQDKATLEYHWHIPLSFALILTKCDNKCRVLMARLLSNFVSSNNPNQRKCSSLHYTNISIQWGYRRTNTTIVD